MIWQLLKVCCVGFYVMNHDPTDKAQHLKKKHANNSQKNIKIIALYCASFCNQKYLWKSMLQVAVKRVFQEVVIHLFYKGV